MPYDACIPQDLRERIRRLHYSLDDAAVSA